MIELRWLNVSGDHRRDESTCAIAAHCGAYVLQYRVRLFDGITVMPESGAWTEWCDVPAEHDVDHALRRARAAG